MKKTKAPYRYRYIVCGTVFARPEKEGREEAAKEDRQKKEVSQKES